MKGLTLRVSQYLSRQKFLFGPSISSSKNYLITRGSQKKISFLRECGLVKKKPAMWTFLKPFHESFSKLEQGVNFTVNGIGNVTCPGVLLGGTCDLRARCLVCNALQYNGTLSCWKCLQQGKQSKQDKEGALECFRIKCKTPHTHTQTHAQPQNKG